MMIKTIKMIKTLKEPITSTGALSPWVFLCQSWSLCEVHRFKFIILSGIFSNWRSKNRVCSLPVCGPWLKISHLNWKVVFLLFYRNLQLLCLIAIDAMHWHGNRCTIIMMITSISGDELVKVVTVSPEEAIFTCSWSYIHSNNSQMMPKWLIQQ